MKPVFAIRVARNIYLTFGAYQIRQENVATADPNGVLCGTRVCQVQAGAAEVKGLEFEGRASLDTGTTLILSASTQDAEVTESNDGIAGNKLAQVPETLASVFVHQTVETGPFEGVGFGGGIRYTGKSFGDSNNTFEMDDTTVFDLFARYDLGQLSDALEGTDLSLNARNVADERYVTTCSTVASCFYGQGRVVTAKLQYRW